MSQRQRHLFMAGLGVLALLVLFLAIGSRGGWNRFLQMPDPPTIAMAVSANVLNADNEGRLVSVQGELLADQAPVDAELGLVASDSIVLVREVEMFQWQENCLQGACTQRTAWSQELIDDSGFREQIGHRNPQRFPLRSASFEGVGIHLGVFVPDADLLISALKLRPRPMVLSELSSNLAASFSISGDGLVSSNNPLQPEVGDLRIRYRMIPAGAVTLQGIQQAERLVDPAQLKKR